jgi:hypothetical protein
MKNKKYEGKNGIWCRIIADSISLGGHRITTFETNFPRWILAEVNTHRELSKNAASSRAVPVGSSIDMILENPAVPVHFGANNPGMVSNVALEGIQLEGAKGMWDSAMRSAVNFARVMSDKAGINGHKQWVNRVIENYTFTRQVITGTKWNNFFWLRDHPDAQPEFRELAHCMHTAYKETTPSVLEAGQWHLPYVDFDGSNYLVGDEVYDLDTAIKISASCCAQVSYRKLDMSIDKVTSIYDKLNIGSTDKPQHVSPTEHQATPIPLNVKPFETNTWVDGITHVRRDGILCSGNLTGWIQYRQLIPGHTRMG